LACNARPSPRLKNDPRPSRTVPVAANQLPRIPRNRSSRAGCRRRAARPVGRNPNITAATVGRLFSPQSRSLGLDRAQYSNAVLAKIICAGSNNTSYQQAQGDLDHLAALDVSDKQVRRLCKRIGDGRVAERDAAVAAYQALPLVERQSAPAGVVPPAAAAVSVDGGRVHIFERLPGGPAAAPAGPAEAAPPPDVVAAATGVPTAGAAPLGPAPTAPAAEDGKLSPAPAAGNASAAAAAAEEGDAQRRGKFWREDKVGLLLTMQSEVSAHDPCPQLPQTFLNPACMTRLVRELKKRAPPQEEAAHETGDPHAAAEALRANEDRWEPPEVEAKQVVATRRCWDQFGPMVATAAWALGLFAAARRAVVADGAENNWTLQRQLFSSFVPVVDFIHGLSYVFASALAGGGFKEGWAVYERWIHWVWSGTVEKVIAELAVRQVALGSPTPDEPEGSARVVVARAWTYLQNNQERMRYAEYRRQGLPITSRYVESAVKQINYRVKGTEKFWNEAGAEERLQLRADYLSDGDVMEGFWKRREANENGQNRYRRGR
jgi:hypothetical protein